MQTSPTNTMNEPPPATPWAPLRALGAIRRLLRDPSDTKQVFEVIQALAGKAPTRVLDKMRASAGGRRLLADKPDLLLRLGDHATLAALPAGSLGRAYLSFIAREGITHDGLVE